MIFMVLLAGTEWKNVRLLVEMNINKSIVFKLFYLTFPKNDDIIIKLSDGNLFQKDVFGLWNTSFQKFF
mgnify:CR=1 FL=1